MYLSKTNKDEFKNMTWTMEQRDKERQYLASIRPYLLRSSMGMKIKRKSRPNTLPKKKKKRIFNKFLTLCPVRTNREQRGCVDIQEGERRGKENEGRENDSDVQVNGAKPDDYGRHGVE